MEASLLNYIEGITPTPDLDILTIFKDSVPLPFKDYCYLQEWKSPSSTHLLVILTGGVKKIFLKVVLKAGSAYWGNNLKEIQVVDGKIPDILSQTFYVVTEPIYYSISPELASVRTSSFQEAILIAKEV